MKIYEIRNNFVIINWLYGRKILLTFHFHCHERRNMVLQTDVRDRRVNVQNKIFYNENKNSRNLMKTLISYQVHTAHTWDIFLQWSQILYQSKIEKQTILPVNLHRLAKKETIFRLKRGFEGRPPSDFPVHVGTKFITTYSNICYELKMWINLAIIFNSQRWWEMKENLNLKSTQS